MLHIKFLIINCLILVSFSLANEHPNLFIAKQEAQDINESLGNYPLLDRAFDKSKSEIDIAISKEIIVPQPGEAGGYEHEKHKQNYRDMQKAGVLFSITGNEEYAKFVRDMLFKYAELYPTLSPHPLSKKQVPGMLFHQMLNETVWLVYASMAYDCIYDWLSEKDRIHIEKNVFGIIVKWFTEKHSNEFDRIHNHGTWAVASIGMLGYVLGDQKLVDLALYGTKKDGSGGFLRQLDLLFSPDGYYMEGPYYIRYALRPFLLFAEAIERNQPELKIFEYRDKILKKAIYTTLQTSFPNGIFPPINDASRSMNIKAPGVLIASDIAYLRYGSEENLLRVANIQNEVILNGAGLKLAKEFGYSKNVPLPQWGSIEFTDGFDGKQGGLGILRTGEDENQSMLLMKYGVHGEGHGHFDKLHFIFYDQGKQIIPDYGYARWVNIEPKYGGRYLPENNTYAKTTIAHNTVVVDLRTQNSGNRKEADKMSAKRHFFDNSNPNVQVMSATANNYYPGVEQQRTMFLINDSQLEYPIVLDVFRIQSANEHVYDYPIHYFGQIITSNFKIETSTDEMQPLGDEFGYEHIWQTGKATVNNPIKFTWLDGQKYYSLISSVNSQFKILLGRIGANDPKFNLISNPMIILRKEAKDFVFASVIEPHGFYSEAQEKSVNARGNIESVKVLGHNESGSVVEISGKNGLQWTVMVNNEKQSISARHKLMFNGKNYEWQGNFKLIKN